LTGLTADLISGNVSVGHGGAFWRTRESEPKVRQFQPDSHRHTLSEEIKMAIPYASATSDMRAREEVKKILNPLWGPRVLSIKGGRDWTSFDSEAKAPERGADSDFRLFREVLSDK